MQIFAHKMRKSSVKNSKITLIARVSTLDSTTIYIFGTVFQEKPDRRKHL